MCLFQMSDSGKHADAPTATSTAPPADGKDTEDAKLRRAIAALTMAMLQDVHKWSKGLHMRLEAEQLDEQDFDAAKEFKEAIALIQKVNMGLGVIGELAADDSPS
jgi:hypothetical protein